MAPLSVIVSGPLAMVVIDLARGVSAEFAGYDLSRTWIAIPAVVLVVYLLTLVVGVPAYLLASKMRVASGWSATAVGIIVPYFPGLLGGFKGYQWLEVMPAAFIGAIVGFVFWLIVSQPNIIEISN